MKECPHCGKEIPNRAVKCKHCNRNLNIEWKSTIDNNPKTTNKVGYIIVEKKERNKKGTNKFEEIIGKIIGPVILIYFILLIISAFMGRTWVTWMMLIGSILSVILFFCWIIIITRK